MNLALDYFRCHDSECPRRHDCERYRDRKKYGPQTPHCESCRRGGEYPDFIPADEAAVLRWIV